MRDGSPHPVNRAGFVVQAAIHRALADAHCVMHTHTTGARSLVRRRTTPTTIHQRNRTTSPRITTPEASTYASMKGSTLLRVSAASDC
ncbi:class II aldolase/adducin family protein [Paraburkholderia phymatum]|nr:class II aldolase/adducin family protein [Paraburkholderia phymatum]